MLPLPVKRTVPPPTAGVTRMPPTASASFNVRMPPPGVATRSVAAVAGAVRRAVPSKSAWPEMPVLVGA